MKVIFDHVSKSFGIINAIKDVNITIESGEFIFLVGPSGAGKSTILKLILSQIKPTVGEIIINDFHLNQLNQNKLNEIRQKIGVIFQDYLLIPDKTVEENISLALEINNVSSLLIPEKIETVLKQVNLSSRRHLFPSQLSGGELQRTSLARALVIEPKIILADEPTGNLDIENSWNLIKLIKDINEKSNTTIIMTSHNMDIVKSLDKRIITLQNGEIISDSKKTHTNLKKK